MQQPPHGARLGVQVKIAKQIAAFNHRKNPIRVGPVALEQKKDFCDNGLAGDQRIPQLFKLPAHPGVRARNATNKWPGKLGRWVAYNRPSDVSSEGRIVGQQPRSVG